MGVRSPDSPLCEPLPDLATVILLEVFLKLVGHLKHFFTKIKYMLPSSVSTSDLPLLYKELFIELMLKA